MSNESLYQEALSHFPGGVSSPVRAFKAVGGTPKFFARAFGAWFVDEEDKQFLDHWLLGDDLTVHQRIVTDCYRLRQTEAAERSFRCRS